MPVQGDGKEAKTFVVRCATEKVRQNRRSGPSRVHRCQTWDRDRVKPRPDIRWEELVDEHASKTVPEHSQRLRFLQIGPVQTLQGLHRGKCAPIYGVNVPHGDWAQQAAETVAEQADRDSRADDRRGLKRHVVEQLLRGEDLGTFRSVCSGSSCDGTDRVLLETPWSRIYKLDNLYPKRKLADTIVTSPTGFEQITTREDLGPTLAHEESNDDDEGSLNRDHSRFELQEGQVRLMCARYESWLTM